MKRPIDILTITPEVYLREADELLERGGVVQASEKYYKAAEEAIKFLTTIKVLEIILSQVGKKKRWSSELLFEAARLLNLLDLWKSAWKLHQDGFHEMVL
ncbi:MAG: PaREP1 family protein, partial [Sulfolobus sp.]|nr:PaREP1 family protein [Sulfolobus sp.]